MKLQTVSLSRSPLPEANYIELPSVVQGRKGEAEHKGPAYDYDNNDHRQREKETKETTGGPRDYHDRSRYYEGPSLCVCDNHHYSLKEEERLAMTTIIGEKALEEGCHYDTMIGMAAMVTTMQDRLQERSSDMRTTTLSDYVIRQTDKLIKILAFFSHGSRAGTTTEGDTKTTRVAETACNGTDYNNCDVSTIVNGYIYKWFIYRIYYFSRHRLTIYTYIHCS